MDAETTDSWAGRKLELSWAWCLLTLLPVILFFATSTVRAKREGLPLRSVATASISSPQR